jgi:hypothetical protein
MDNAYNKAGAFYAVCRPFHVLSFFENIKQIKRGF